MDNTGEEKSKAENGAADGRESYRKRRLWIDETLRQKAFLSLEELRKKFPGVSEMTLRRDIEYFERQGKAIKVHGGAKSTKFMTTDDPFTSRMGKNTGAKLKIAQKAVEYLSVGCSIFLDSGSTIQNMVKFIPNERYVFTTTAPQTALDLSRTGLFQINLAGGRLDRNYQTVTGRQAVDFISGINIETAIMSASGFSLDCGFTGGNPDECELKHTVIEKARQVIMLLDSSKFDRSLPYTFAKLENINILICDNTNPLPDELIGEAKKLGVEVVIAE